MSLRLGFWFFLLATLGYVLYMKLALGELSSSTIVAYELARTTKKANIVLDQVSRASNTKLLHKSFYIDFGFLVLYGLNLFIGLRYAVSLSEQVDIPLRWARLGNKLAWVGIIAMGCDAIENLALLQQLPPATPTPLMAGLAWVVACIKFGAIGLTVSAMLFYFGYYFKHKK
jgi:hypothetical protein